MLYYFYKYVKGIKIEKTKLNTRSNLFKHGAGIILKIEKIRNIVRLD